MRCPAFSSFLPSYSGNEEPRIRRLVQPIRMREFFLSINPRPDSESSASKIMVAQDEFVETLNPASMPAGLSSQILGVSGAPYSGLSGRSS